MIRRQDFLPSPFQFISTFKGLFKNAASIRVTYSKACIKWNLADKTFFPFKPHSALYSYLKLMFLWLHYHLVYKSNTVLTTLYLLFIVSKKQRSLFHTHCWPSGLTINQILSLQIVSKYSELLWFSQNVCSLMLFWVLWYIISLHSSSSWEVPCSYSSSFPTASV
jgi:hypothetical protein